jgi:hypothetical protein
MNEIPQPPKPGTGDHLHTVARAIIGVIPVVGSPAVELFNSIVTPPIERRRDEWREAVGQRLQEIADAGYLNPNELGSNATFITTLMHASAAAVRNHQAEKLDALRNAVLNSALPNPPGDSIQQVFVSYVDLFTVWHLRILKFLESPWAWFERNGKAAPQFSIAGSIERVLLAAYPDLSDQRDFYSLIEQDLTTRGLSRGKFFLTMGPDGVYDKHTTAFGDQFLKFIAEPVTTTPAK